MRIALAETDQISGFDREDVEEAAATDVAIARNQRCLVVGVALKNRIEPLAVVIAMTRRVLPTAAETVRYRRDLRSVAPG